MLVRKPCRHGRQTPVSAFFSYCLRGGNEYFEEVFHDGNAWERQAKQPTYSLNLCTASINFKAVGALYTVRTSQLLFGA